MGPDAVAIPVVAGLVGTVSVVAIREEAGCSGHALRCVSGTVFGVWAHAVLGAGVRTLLE